MNPYADLLEAYLEECVRFTPRSPVYYLEMWHWQKTRPSHAKPRSEWKPTGRPRVLVHKVSPHKKPDLALRAELHPPCECGKPYFANGKCRPCYFREYNRTHVRNHNRKAA